MDLYSQHNFDKCYPSLHSHMAVRNYYLPKNLVSKFKRAELMGQMPYCKETIIFIALIITITFCVLFDTNFSYKSIFDLNFITNVFFLESME